MPISNRTTQGAIASTIIQRPTVEGPEKEMRGKTGGLNADKVHEQLSTKIPVTFKKENGRPTGPYAEMFANEIGFTIRNHAPLNVKKWKEVKPEDRTSYIKRITTKYNIDMSLPWVQLNTLKWSTKTLKRGWDLGAKELWDQMVKMRTETTLPDGTRTINDDEICAKVLGVKSGYIKGCGFGPRPRPSSTSRSSIDEMSEKNKELEDKHEETQDTIKAQQEKIDAQNVLIQELQEQGKKFEQFMAIFMIQQASS